MLARSACLRRACRLAVVASVLSGLIALTQSASRADELPRYKLKVGQELVYRTTDPPKQRDDGEGGTYTHSYNIEWTIDVIDENADGGWRLVFVQKFASSIVREGKQRKQELLTDGYVDLAPDGRLIENRTLGPMADPSVIFPPLPPDEASLSSTWSATLAIDDTRRKLRASAEPSTAANSPWLFTEEPQSIFDSIYQSETRRQYVFDLRRGLVTKVTTTTTQTGPDQGSAEPSVRTIELAGSRMLDDVDHKTLRDEMNRYLAAREKYEALAARASSDFSHSANGIGHTVKLLADAAAQLNGALEQLTLPPVRKLVENKLRQHASSSQDTLENALRFGLLIGRPSPDWTTTDLEENPRSLEDYRGQVVLLDFWYRGCGWCIRAMPQIKQLAGDFAGRNVAVLGINNDDNLDDARFVIEKLGLNYPTLQNDVPGGSIDAKYKVNLWPTLVVLDGKGIVRHIHTGYSPTLRHDLSEIIRELLAEN